MNTNLKEKIQEYCEDKKEKTSEFLDERTRNEETRDRLFAQPSSREFVDSYKRDKIFKKVCTYSIPFSVVAAICLLAKGDIELATIFGLEAVCGVGLSRECSHAIDIKTTKALKKYAEVPSKPRVWDPNTDFSDLKMF